MYINILGSKKIILMLLLQQNTISEALFNQQRSHMLQHKRHKNLGRLQRASKIFYKRKVLIDNDDDETVKMQLYLS